MILRGYEFDVTCEVCPEQYDVFLNGKPVLYIRLRWGILRAELTDSENNLTDEYIFEHKFGDDMYKGEFDHDTERYHFLNLILDAYEQQGE